jgi:anaerobic dimethyl sulfoxide reductase subunit B (iron-sulfur subunit)
MQYGFYFDQTRCVGCNTCSVSCKDFNQINPGHVRWRTHKLQKQCRKE